MRPVKGVLQEKHLDMQVPPVENPTFSALEEYDDLSKTLHLDFAEDYIMWVASKLSGTSGALRAEEIKIRNWTIRFGCVPYELRV